MAFDLGSFSTGIGLATPNIIDISSSGTTGKSGLLSGLFDKVGGMQGLGSALGGLGSIWSAYNAGQANKQNYNLMRKMYNADQTRLGQAQDNLDTAVLSLGDYSKKYGA